MVTDIVVRPATSVDLPAIGRLGALLVKTHHDFDAKRFMAPTRETASGYASFLASQLDQPDVVMLVAAEDEQVIGYTYAAVEGPDWMSLRGEAGVLHDIVIGPEGRGRGAGRMLLDATVAALQARGATQVVLSAAQRNTAAQRLFASAGFRPTMIEMTRDLDTTAGT